MQTEMSQRYRKFKRGWGVYHVYDNTTGLSKSLDTRSKQDADRLVHAMNEAERQPIMNRQMARAYLMASDPLAMTRTWQFVMDEKVKTVTGATKERWLTAIRDQAFNLIRSATLVETRPEDFKAVLEAGRVATNVFLRKLHNFALDMNWLLGPVLAKAKWPKVNYPPKRAITEEEHHRICEREPNPERRAFYGVLLHTGASQTDAAFMAASNVDLQDKLLTYHRRKTREPAQIEIGPELEAILRTLPASGPLFPYLRRVRANDRASEFRQRCDGLSIRGVTLHSCRYAWAQRAKAMGYPERYAQQALGHASKAMSRAYAKDGGVRLPSLETWEHQTQERLLRADFKEATSPEAHTPAAAILRRAVQVPCATRKVNGLSDFTHPSLVPGAARIPRHHR